MAVKPMDWLQGPWSVELYSVNTASYSSLDLKNCLYPNWIISYVKEGDVATGTGEEVYRVRPGEVMLHPPNLLFAEQASMKGTHLWMQAAVFCSQHIDLLQLCRIAPVVAVADPDRFEAVFRQLEHIWENKEQPFWNMKMTSGVIQLTELILTGWEKAGFPERTAAYESPKERFVEMIGYMSLRLQEKLSREDLAAVVNLSPNYLDKSFARRYGHTPMQMLRDMRLNRSRQLLERTEETLDSIAQQCGLSDAPYLCRQFKRVFGIQPGEYRESVRSLQAENPYQYQR
ncbi:helix-turn-helix domain-containing protein [Paenibacillus nasutitermitis]|uniref:HTH araC/xylS-type domain-containing protein n=1 Tax=Paenibacillus nasutitermitis TaxID=1652958 RepID=A0A916YRP1_9BACL|nr:AraC family transcriptional regulator [Paenibacillus nasutitermitis]GGD58335.1 hypothetical protein GCM10010911_15160 [Paenibacillus nasutitermitis]